MINQQLLDYIKQQLQLGVSREQIKNSLTANGWLAQDVEEGFNTISHSIPLEQYPNLPTKVSMKTWKIIIASLISVAVIGGGIYFATQKFFKPEGTSKQPANQPPVNNQPAEITPVSELPTEQPQEIIVATNCDAFPDKLSSCAKYKCQFIHLLTEESMEKEILGIINEKCNYVEQMPNGGKMECKFTESAKEAVAKYYKALAAAESSIETNVNLKFGANINLGSGEQTIHTDGQKTTYSIDGKVVENPMQEAMDNGMCVISGY